MTTPDTMYEMARWKLGERVVVGLDEVGRGALAGPVVVGAAVLPPYAPTPPGLRDSKLLTPRARADMEPRLRTLLAGWTIGEASATEIDERGIVAATFLAMRRALARLPPADYLLLDAFALPDYPVDRQTAVIKGDARIASIAAASVLAKCHRDRLMASLDIRVPEYGFRRHKGYGTAAHRAALSRLGPSAVHRRSFLHLAALA